MSLYSLRGKDFVKIWTKPKKENECLLKSISGSWKEEVVGFVVFSQQLWLGYFRLGEVIVNGFTARLGNWSHRDYVNRRKATVKIRQTHYFLYYHLEVLFVFPQPA